MRESNPPPPRPFSNSSLAVTDCFVRMRYNKEPVSKEVELYFLVIPVPFPFPLFLFPERDPDIIYL